MSGAWWGNDNSLTGDVAEVLGLRAPVGLRVIEGNQEWLKRTTNALKSCEASYCGVSTTKGGSVADRMFSDVMGLALTFAWMFEAIDGTGLPMDVDRFISSLAQAVHGFGRDLQHCHSRAKKLVLDGFGEFCSLIVLAMHPEVDWVAYSGVADSRGVDAIVKIYGLPEQSVQVKRKFKIEPSVPGIWRIETGTSSGESVWVEPASVVIASPNAADRYVKLCVASHFESRSA